MGQKDWGMHYGRVLVNSDLCCHRRQSQGHSTKKGQTMLPEAVLLRVLDKLAQVRLSGLYVRVNIRF